MPVLNLLNIFVYWHSTQKKNMPTSFYEKIVLIVVIYSFTKYSFLHCKFSSLLRNNNYIKTIAQQSAKIVESFCNEYRQHFSQILNVRSASALVNRLLSLQLKDRIAVQMAVDVFFKL